MITDLVRIGNVSLCLLSLGDDIENETVNNLGILAHRERRIPKRREGILPFCVGGVCV